MSGAKFEPGLALETLSAEGAGSSVESATCARSASHYLPSQTRPSRVGIGLTGRQLLCSRSIAMHTRRALWRSISDAAMK